MTADSSNLGTDGGAAVCARLRRLFEPAALGIVMIGVLDRRRAVALLVAETGVSPESLATTPREELIAKLVRGFAEDDRLALAVVSELDFGARTERSLVASLPAPEVAQAVAAREFLRLRRHGAKLVWALAQDERQAVVTLAGGVLRAYVDQFGRLERARDKVRQLGGEAELEEFDSVYRDAAERALELEEEFSVVEKERARLLAEIGKRELELRAESERRERLAAEIAGLKQAREPAVSPPAAKGASAEGGETLRRLQKSLAAATRECEALKAKAAGAAELAAENARLRATIESLRELRAKEKAVVRPLLHSETTVPAPLVAPPPGHKGKRGEGGDARLGVFLDVANLSGAARRLFGRAIDFGRLLDLARAGRQLSEARAYVIDKGGRGFDAFATSLRKSGFKVLAKKPKTFEDGTVKADWDVGLVVDVLGTVGKLDAVLLGSGDGDFVPLVNALKQQGVRVEIAAFAARAAAELMKSADRVLALDASVLED